MAIIARRKFDEENVRLDLAQREKNAEMAFDNDLNLALKAESQRASSRRQQGSDSDMDLNTPPSSPWRSRLGEFSPSTRFEYEINDMAAIERADRTLLIIRSVNVSFDDNFYNISISPTGVSNKFINLHLILFT